MSIVVALQEPAAATVDQLPNDRQEEDGHSATTDLLCKAFGMDPNPQNELEKPDLNFLEEISKLPIDFSAVPKGTDVQAMRQWIDSTLLQGLLAEDRARCKVNRRSSELPVDIHDVSVPCSDNSGQQFRIRVYDPAVGVDGMTERSRPAIFMFHGGGWIHGKPEGDDGFAIVFASELRAVVFGVDYRLAPEHPFPAPLDDCCEALDWVTRNAAAYNVDTDRMALWGASAGGNLAAAVALRETQQPLSSNGRCLRMVSLVVPAIAHPKAEALFEKNRAIEKSQSEEAFAGSPTASEAVIEEFEKLYDLYTAGLTDWLDPLVSPLMAKPDSKHPPTHVTVGACDLLKYQDLAYAQLLRSSGVTVTEDILCGVPHGFTFAVNANVAKRWTERQVDLCAAAFEIDLPARSSN